MPTTLFGASRSPFDRFALKSSPMYLPFVLMPEKIQNIALTSASRMHSKLCCLLVPV